MKIGIMGGTFDRSISDIFCLACLHMKISDWMRSGFCPTEIRRISRQKRGKRRLDTGSRWCAVRSVMCRISGFACMKQRKKSIPTHTRRCGNYARFIRRIPFYFILGADSLFAIEEWKYFREIFPTCTILAAMRDDKDVEDMMRQIAYLEDTYGAKISLLRAPLLEISSTTLRERAAQGKSVAYMVPHAVEEYMQEHALYRKGE